MLFYRTIPPPLAREPCTRTEPRTALVLLHIHQPCIPHSQLPRHNLLHAPQETVLLEPVKHNQIAWFMTTQHIYQTLFVKLSHFQCKRSLHLLFLGPLGSPHLWQDICLWSIRFDQPRGRYSYLYGVTKLNSQCVRGVYQCSFTSLQVHAQQVSTITGTITL